MNKTINKIKNFCNGPITSNVIATLIASFVIFLAQQLYPFIRQLYAQLSLGSFADFATKTISIDVSLFSFALIALISVLSLAFLLIYSLRTFYKTIRRILNKKYKQQYPYPNLLSSTANFSLRIAQSFPGTRGIRWVENPIAIRKHLKNFFGEAFYGFECRRESRLGCAAIRGHRGFGGWQHRKARRPWLIPPDNKG